ncbi:hypothetical protein PMAYCL1PPCAC_19362, partial [Pristionchus mayeri]
QAKPKEMNSLLIPLIIGLALAFLPLLTSTAFMSVAGVSNVVCGTIFHDKGFGFLPKALTILNQPSNYSFGGINVDIQSLIAECKNGKTLINALDLGSKLSEDEITKRFNVDEKNREITEKINGMSFGLPTDSDWADIAVTGNLFPQ